MLPSKLPTYNSDEVKEFHPLLEDAFRVALKELGLEAELEIIHHESVGSLVADFAVKRKSTGKYTLFVEVKRKPADVTSTRYRGQAQFYVTQSLTNVEKPYYAITNLEVTDFFRYDSVKPTVVEQLLEGSPYEAGRFSSSLPSDFFSNLVHIIKMLIQTSLADSGKYKNLTENLANLLRNRKSDLTKWHQLLSVVGYEYVRGALSLGWQDAIRFRARPNRLLDTGRALNFTELFSEPVPDSDDSYLWNPILLGDSQKTGQQRKSGDELAEVIHLIASEGRETEGLVATDMELARFMSVLVATVLGRDLDANEVICDPAAGSGALLNAMSSGFPTLTYRQIWANEREVLFREHLSVRLGLGLGKGVSLANTPRITLRDVRDLTREDFDKVSVVVMNPPYQAGIDASLEKEVFAQKYQSIFGSESSVNVGQVGLEIPFLEFVLGLMKEGTVLGVILPKQYLNAKGKEAEAFRDFLLHQFGLCLVATYPKEGLFERVKKATTLFVGIKGKSAKDILAIEVGLPLAQVNADEMGRQLRAGVKSGSLTTGVEIKSIFYKELIDDVGVGWSKFTQVGNRIDQWIKSNLAPFCKPVNHFYKVKRGEVGNKGASDLIFISSDEKIWAKLKPLIPSSWLKPGLRKVDELSDTTMYLDRKTSEVLVLCPPENAFSPETDENKELQSIINFYLSVQTVTSKQTKKEKNITELIKIIQNDASRSSRAGTVLVPRSLRRYGRAFMLNEDGYLSTNVVKVAVPDKETGRLLLAWLISLFGLLHREYLGKDQEGTRKIEIQGGVDSLLIPDFSRFDRATKETILTALETSKFQDLCDPQITELDQVLAVALWPGVEKEVLLQVRDLLEDIVFERYPEGF
jgi:hypothetical protein